MFIFEKIILTFLTILALTTIARYVGARYAGILAGFPLGCGIALYFIGVEQGVHFSIASSYSTATGLSAGLLAVLSLHYSFLAFLNTQLRYLSILIGLLVFGLSISVLDYIPWQSNETNHFLTPLIILLAYLLLKKTRRWEEDRLSAYENLEANKEPSALVNNDVDSQRRSIANGVDETPTYSLSNASLLRKHQLILALIFRATLATLAVLAITGLAYLLTPQTAGLLAAFPISFYPSLMFLLIWGAPGIVAETVRHYPQGLIAMVLYLWCLPYCLQHYDLLLGTLTALLLTTFYLLALALVSYLTGRR